MSSFKKARYTEEPVYLHSDGSITPYVPEAIVTNRDAYAASMHLLFAHVADFHMLMVEIVADKCNLDAKEIISVIQGDPRYKEMKVDPVLNSLLLFEKKDVEKHIEVEELTSKLAEATIAPKKKIVRKVAAPVVAPVVAAPVVAAPVGEVPVVAPKKVVRRVVKTSLSQ
jgi:hypothetical protein